MNFTVIKYKHKIEINTVLRIYKALHASCKMTSQRKRNLVSFKADENSYGKMGRGNKYIAHNKIQIMEHADKHHSGEVSIHCWYKFF